MPQHRARSQILGPAGRHDERCRVGQALHDGFAALLGREVGDAVGVRVLLADFTDAAFEDFLGGDDGDTRIRILHELD